MYGGMGLILPKVKTSKFTLMVSALVINTLDAERVLILNRFSGERIAHFRVSDGDNLRVLPIRYSISPSLAVVMFDDNDEFNAAIADNVQPIIVDLISLDTNNPLPYETKI